MLNRYTRKLMALAKKVVDKRTYKKLKELKEEKNEAIEYSIISAFRKKQSYLEDEIKMLKGKKDIFFAEAKLCMLPGKISVLKSTFHERDFEKLSSLIKEIEEDIKNV